MPHRIRNFATILSALAVLAVIPAAWTPLEAQTLLRKSERPIDGLRRLGEDLPDYGEEKNNADGQGEAGSEQGNNGLRGSVSEEEEAQGSRQAGVDAEAPLERITEEEDKLPKALAVDEDPVREEAEEEDPYAAQGVRLGGFLLFPELAVESVYNDNIFLSSTRPEGDWALELTPSLSLRSDWSRHSLEANFSGVRSYHEEFETENDETFSANVTGQLDIRRDTNIIASTGYSKSLEDRGSNDFPSNAAERAATRNRDASLEGNHTLNRVTLTLRGELSEENFDDSVASDGSNIDNSDRDYAEQRLTGRVAYEFQPGVQAFVEASTNDRNFERKTDSNGLLNGSSGHEVQAGLAFKLTGKLTGEASAGYALQTPDERTLKDVNGLIFNAALEYKATALTTLRFDAASEIEETTSADSAGSINRSVEFSVEHKPRRNIILGASIAYENEQFSGINETDEDVVVGLTGEYLFTPSVGLIVSYEHGESMSSTPGSDYSTDEVRMGMRFRR